MRSKQSKKLYYITLEYPKGLSKSVAVRAVTREVAERRALKRNPSAIGVKHNA